MHTDPTIPRSPFSHTALLHDAGPPPYHVPAFWPSMLSSAPPPATQRSRDLMATRRALADEALVRRMVAECAAMVDGEARA